MIDHLDDPIAVNQLGPSVVVSFGRSHDDRMLITWVQARSLANELLEIVNRPIGARPLPFPQ